MLKVTQGPSLIEFWDAPSGGNQLTIAPDGYVESWPMTGGYASKQVWVHAKDGSAVGPGTIALQAVNYDTLNNPPVLYAQDSLNFVTKAQETIVVVVGASGVQPVGATRPTILTAADWQWVQDQRAAFLASLGDLRHPAMPPGSGPASVLETCLTMAQEDLRQANRFVNRLVGMEADPATTSAGYRDVYLRAFELYDVYMVNLVQVDIAKARYIAAAWRISESDPLLRQCGLLPTTIGEFADRGMTRTAAELNAVKKSGRAIYGAVGTYLDTVDFVDGAIRSIAVGTTIVAAFATMGPVAAMYFGGILLAGGTISSLNSRITNDHLTGDALITSTLSDVSGWTSLQIGLTDIDPVTGRQQNLSGSDRGWQFGSGFVALCTFTYQGAKVTRTVRMNWTDLANFIPPRGLQPVGGGAVPSTTFFPAVVPCPTANVAVATLAGPGGVQLVLMAAKPAPPKVPPSSRDDGHMVDWKLQDANRRIIAHDEEISGTGFSLKPGTRLSWPDQSWYGHTEGKIIGDLMEAGKLEPGQVLTIDGTKPPCGGCQTIMQWASETFQITIQYLDGAGEHWTWVNGVLSH